MTYFQWKWLQRPGVVAAALLVALAPQAAAALEQVRIGKSFGTTLAFVPLEIGQRAGIWEAHGVELDIQIFAGGARAMQGMAAGEIDMLVGEGAGMAFIHRGVPALAVAAVDAGPRDIVLIGATNADITSVEDLRGRNVGVTTAGSLTDWVVRKLNALNGWDTDPINPLPLGDVGAQDAAMERGEIQGRAVALVQAIEHERLGTARTLLSFGDLITDFYTHAMYAHNDMIAERPEVVQAVVNGWWDVVAYMETNPEQSIEWTAEIIGQPIEAVTEAFPVAMAMLTDIPDGSFNEASLDVLGDSFIELGLLSEKPDMSTLYTTQFLPPQPAQ